MILSGRLASWERGGREAELQGFWCIVLSFGERLGHMAMLMGEN
jgi:hypothetical protein